MDPKTWGKQLIRFGDKYPNTPYKEAFTDQKWAQFLPQRSGVHTASTVSRLRGMENLRGGEALQLHNRPEGEREHGEVKCIGINTAAAATTEGDHHAAEGQQSRQEGAAGKGLEEFSEEEWEPILPDNDMEERILTIEASMSEAIHHTQRTMDRRIGVENALTEILHKLSLMNPHA